MKPEIIITARGHAGTMATLQSEFTAHLLADAPDRAAFLKQHAPNVRGVATFGPMPVDGKFMDALPKLEIISNFGVGVDAINLVDAKKRGIREGLPAYMTTPEMSRSGGPNFLGAQHA